MMEPRLRRAGPRGLLAAILMVVAASACSREISTPVANDELQGMSADYVQFGMVSVVTSNGVRQGRVEADTAYVFQETTTVNLHQMRIVFHDESGTEIATVTGTSGDMNYDSNQMVARGDVVLLVHADSSRIESPVIHYDPEQERIWSDSTTVRTMKDGTVTSGTAFESDMSFENVRIENPRGGVRRVF